MSNQFPNYASYAGVWSNLTPCWKLFERWEKDFPLRTVVKTNELYDYRKTLNIEIHPYDYAKAIKILEDIGVYLVEYQGVTAEGVLIGNACSKLDKVENIDGMVDIVQLLRRNSWHAEDLGAYIPSEDEIKKKCAEIRGNWRASEFKQRSMGKDISLSPYAEVPSYKPTDFSNQNG